MTAEQFAKVQRGDIGPAWRARLAECASGNARIPEEPLIREARDYFELSESDPRLARARHPGIAAAVDLQDLSPTTRAMKLAVIADMDREEMCRRLHVPVSTIELWETLYFDVRGCTQAIDWMWLRVIRPERDAGHLELAAQMKLAVSAGLVGVRLLLDGIAGIPLDPVERLFERRLKLQAKFHAAEDWPVESGDDSDRFTEWYSELMLQQQRIDLTAERLRQKCIEAERRHELRVIQAKERIRKSQKSSRRQKRQAERKVTDQTLLRAAADAERNAVAARAASSPLSILTWNSAAASDASVRADIRHDAAPVRAAAESRSPVGVEKCGIAVDECHATRLPFVLDLIA